MDLRKKISSLDSSDVIFWLLEQTCCGIEQLQSLYISQGVDFCRRAQAALDNPNILYDSTQSTEYLNLVRQVELQSLDQLYGLSKQKPGKSLSFCPSLAKFNQELATLRAQFKDVGTAVQSIALQEVEQERETEHEVENVREVQKQLHFNPHKFVSLHQDILVFAKTGRLMADSGGVDLAFDSLRKHTDLGSKYAVCSGATCSKLYVSSEFSRTVDQPIGRGYDNFQVNLHSPSFVHRN